MLGQEEDLDQCIIHITESIFLPHGPFQSRQDVICGFVLLASCLLSRFSLYKRPEDINFSLKYFQHLRAKSHSFGYLPNDRLISNHVRALAHHVILTNDVVEEMEEMASLCRELLTSDKLIGYTRDAIFDYAIATVEVFRRSDAMQPPERVIAVLRLAKRRQPDWHHVSFALAHCLAIRFQMTHDISFYEEAISTADEIIDPRHLGNNLTPTQKRAIELIVTLITDRLNFYAQPKYLLNSLERLRILRDIPSLPRQLQSSITELLDRLGQRRRDYFSAQRNSIAARPSTSSGIRGSQSSRTRVEFRRTIELSDNSRSEIDKRALILKESLIAIHKEKPTDIEETVKYGRTLVISPHSGHRLPIPPVNDLAQFLFEAYRHTSRLDHLNEAIITFRRILRVPGTDRICFHVAERLLSVVGERWSLFHERQDFEEMMSLFSGLVSSESEAAFHRFPISCQWASKARDHAHPRTSDAYEMAMSLMQETLIFSPTLQTQHSRLVETLREFEGMPLDYPSYQIETLKSTQAVQTLERGRTLLWSEMRGFRTSTDQLFAAEPDLAEKFTHINRELEKLTMSCDETDGDEGVMAFSGLILRQRKLLKDRESVISHIQTLPSFENFLKPPLFDVLNQAASCGPVIIINQSTWRSDVLILLKDSLPSVITTPPDLHDRAKALKVRLFSSRNRHGLDSADYELTLASVLAELYTLIGKPVINRLRQLKIPAQSRVWWCPTAAFCSLPLHAMGPIPSDDGGQLYFMDLYITSYTTSLSALIESRKHCARDEKFDLPPMLLVALPDKGLPGVQSEIAFMRGLSIPVTCLLGEQATPISVVEALQEHRFVHVACRGTLEEGKPFDASFGLHDNTLTLLDVVRSRLPSAEFAFLSAGHAAELTSGSVDDEGLHLTAAMQYCGFRSVIGTLWKMVDMDGAFMAKAVYSSIFSIHLNQGVPYHERSAKALQYAVRRLRQIRGITFERWVNFVHYGA